MGTATVDVGAADERFGTMRGQLERTDRYGSWTSPGFPEDSPVFTHEPARIAPEAEAGADRETLIALSRSVLVQDIVQILDTPLLFEADNSRSTEVGPALVEAFSRQGVDPHAFDKVFATVPVSGTPDPERGLTELFSLEPAAYTAEEPRLHLLEIGSVVDRLVGVPVEGVRVTASASVVIPVTVDGAEELWHRITTLTFGVGDDDSTVLVAYGVGGAGVSRWVEDPQSLPVIEAPTAPEGWSEHTVEALTVSVPPEVEARAPIQHGLPLGDGSGPGGMISHHLLPASSPYPLSSGQHVARCEIPGAGLAVAEVDEIEDGKATVTLVVHGKDDQYRVQLTGFPLEQAEDVALGLLATARLAS